MNKKLALALLGVAGYYTVGVIMTKATVVPGMKRMLNYGTTDDYDVEDCSAEEVEPTAK